MYEDHIRLFVGCSPNGEDAESLMVLEYSVKKNTTLPVEIVWMHHTNNTNSHWYGWKSENWATPFSGFRWGIPSYCSNKGQAIYCDSDMIFLSDLKGLWEQKFESGKIIMGKGGGSWRFCVAKWNCEEAAKVMPSIEAIKNTPQAHQALINQVSNSSLVQPFEGNWNCVDGEGLDIEEIDCLHYSDMSTQFHLKYALPRLKNEGKKHWFDGKVEKHWRDDLQDLFDLYYNEAIASGYKIEDYVFNSDVSYTKESQKNYSSGHKGI